MSRICEQLLIERECAEGERGQKRWGKCGQEHKRPKMTETETTCELHKCRMGWIAISRAPAHPIKPSHGNLHARAQTHKVGLKAPQRCSGATDHVPLIPCSRGALLPVVSTPPPRNNDHIRGRQNVAVSPIRARPVRSAA